MIRDRYWRDFLGFMIPIWIGMAVVLAALWLIGPPLPPI